MAQDNQRFSLCAAPPGSRRWLLPLCAAVSVVLLPVAAVAQTVTRGPYLQLGTDSSMTIVWRTDTASDSKVSYGLSPAALNRSRSDKAAVTQHQVKLDGLSAATRYTYNVGTTTKVLAGGTKAFSFVTAPTAGKAAKVRFWVAGDTRSQEGDTSGTRKVMDAMLTFCGASKPHLFLNPGDIVESGQDSQFTSEFFVPYKDLLRDTVCWPTLGNHDLTPSGSTAAYEKVFVLPRAAEAGGVASNSERYYAFDHANVHIVVLDSELSIEGTGQPMLGWLKKDLAANKLPWVIGMWHRPPYAKGGHDSDSEDNMVLIREKALPLLESGGLDLAFVGHSHIYARTALVGGAYDTPTTAKGKVIDSGDGQLLGSGAYIKKSGSGKAAVYVVAGHGGATLHDKPAPPHVLTTFTEKGYGSCIVTVDRKVLRMVSLRADGTVADRFTMVKGPSLVLGSPDGGERLKPGTVHTIRWATVLASSARVRLDYSSDGGGSWNLIAASVPNSGSHAWTVPAVITSRAVVRVTSTDDASLHDDSDGHLSIGALPSGEIIARGASWKYNDRGVDHKSAWLAAGFDDSAWPSGSAELGYGDGDEATVLQMPTPRYPSVTFRKSVTIPAAPATAKLTVVHDDGVAVWANGRKVMSKYVANGTHYASWASQLSQDNELSSVELKGAALSALKVGKNLIAVMVKQHDAASSDTSFDLQLTLTYARIKPLFPPPTPRTVTEGSRVSFTVKATHPLGNPLSYAALGLPAGAIFVPTTRTFDWTPPRGSAGSHTITFSATDPMGQSALATVSIKVTRLPTPTDLKGDQKPKPHDIGPDLGSEGSRGGGGCVECAVNQSNPAAPSPLLVLAILLTLVQRRRKNH